MSDIREALKEVLDGWMDQWMDGACGRTNEREIEAFDLHLEDLN